MPAIQLMFFIVVIQFHFKVQNPAWTPGATYYILFGSGTASGTAFCGPESAPITGKYLFLH